MVATFHDLFMVIGDHLDTRRGEFSWPPNAQERLSEEAFDLVRFLSPRKITCHLVRLLRITYESFPNIDFICILLRSKMGVK